MTESASGDSKMHFERNDITDIHGLLKKLCAAENKVESSLSTLNRNLKRIGRHVNRLEDDIFFFEWRAHSKLALQQTRQQQSERLAVSKDNEKSVSFKAPPDFVERHETEVYDTDGEVNRTEQNNNQQQSVAPATGQSASSGDEVPSKSKVVPASMDGLDEEYEPPPKKSKSQSEIDKTAQSAASDHAEDKSNNKLANQKARGLDDELQYMADVAANIVEMATMIENGKINVAHDKDMKRGSGATQSSEIIAQESATKTKTIPEHVAASRPSFLSNGNRKGDPSRGLFTRYSELPSVDWQYIKKRAASVHPDSFWSSDDSLSDLSIDSLSDSDEDDAYERYLDDIVLRDLRAISSDPFNAAKRTATPIVLPSGKSSTKGYECLLGRWNAQLRVKSGMQWLDLPSRKFEIRNTVPSMMVRLVTIMDPCSSAPTVSFYIKKRTTFIYDSNRKLVYWTVIIGWRTEQYQLEFTSEAECRSFVVFVKQLQRNMPAEDKSEPILARYAAEELIAADLVQDVESTNSPLLGEEQANDSKQEDRHDREDREYQKDFYPYEENQKDKEKIESYKKYQKYVLWPSLSKGEVVGDYENVKSRTSGLRFDFQGIAADDDEFVLMMEPSSKKEIDNASLKTFELEDDDGDDLASACPTSTVDKKDEQRETPLRQPVLVPKPTRPGTPAVRYGDYNIPYDESQPIHLSAYDYLCSLKTAMRESTPRPSIMSSYDSVSLSTVADAKTEQPITDAEAEVLSSTRLSSLSAEKDYSNASNILNPLLPRFNEVRQTKYLSSTTEGHATIATFYGILYATKDHVKWLHRGTGDLKISRCVDGDARITMVNKSPRSLVCDHFIREDTKLVKKTDRYFSWAGLDYAEGTPIPTTFNFYMSKDGNTELFEKIMTDERNRAAASLAYERSLPNNDAILPGEPLSLGNTENVIFLDENPTLYVFNKRIKAWHQLYEIAFLKISHIRGVTFIWAEFKVPMYPNGRLALKHEIIPGMVTFFARDLKNSVSWSAIDSLYDRKHATSFAYVATTTSKRIAFKKVFYREEYLSRGTDSVPSETCRCS